MTMYQAPDAGTPLLYYHSQCTDACIFLDVKCIIISLIRARVFTCENWMAQISIQLYHWSIRHSRLAMPWNVSRGRRQKDCKNSKNFELEFVQIIKSKFNLRNNDTIVAVFFKSSGNGLMVWMIANSWCFRIFGVPQLRVQFEWTCNSLHQIDVTNIRHYSMEKKTVSAMDDHTGFELGSWVSKMRLWDTGWSATNVQVTLDCCSPMWMILLAHYSRIGVTAPGPVL